PRLAWLRAGPIAELRSEQVPEQVFSLGETLTQEVLSLIGPADSTAGSWLPAARLGSRDALWRCFHERPPIGNAVSAKRLAAWSALALLGSGRPRAACFSRKRSAGRADGEEDAAATRELLAPVH
ncbi:unnamed protein product, partial [Polarella glacialis]